MLDINTKQRGVAGIDGKFTADEFNNLYTEFKNLLSMFPNGTPDGTDDQFKRLFTQKFSGIDLILDDLSTSLSDIRSGATSVDNALHLEGKTVDDILALVPSFITVVDSDFDADSDTIENGIYILDARNINVSNTPVLGAANPMAVFYHYRSNDNNVRGQIFVDLSSGTTYRRVIDTRNSDDPIVTEWGKDPTRDEITLITNSISDILSGKTTVGNALKFDGYTLEEVKDMISSNITEITEDVDLNNLLTPGKYYVNDTQVTVTNYPGQLSVDNHLIIEVIGKELKAFQQRVTYLISGQSFIREIEYDSGNSTYIYNNWVKNVERDEIDKIVSGATTVGNSDRLAGRTYADVVQYIDDQDTVLDGRISAVRTDLESGSLIPANSNKLEGLTSTEIISKASYFRGINVDDPDNVMDDGLYLYDYRETSPEYNSIIMGGITKLYNFRIGDVTDPNDKSRQQLLDNGYVLYERYSDSSGNFGTWAKIYDISSIRNDLDNAIESYQPLLDGLKRGDLVPAEYITKIYPGSPYYGVCMVEFADGGVGVVHDNVITKIPGSKPKIFVHRVDFGTLADPVSGYYVMDWMEPDTGSTSTFEYLDTDPKISTNYLNNIIDRTTPIDLFNYYQVKNTHTVVPVSTSGNVAYMNNQPVTIDDYNYGVTGYGAATITPYTSGNEVLFKVDGIGLKVDLSYSDYSSNYPLYTDYDNDTQFCEYLITKICDIEGITRSDYEFVFGNIFTYHDEYNTSSSFYSMILTLVQFTNKNDGTINLKLYGFTIKGDDDGNTSPSMSLNGKMIYNIKDDLSSPFAKIYDVCKYFTAYCETSYRKINFELILLINGEYYRVLGNYYYSNSSTAKVRLGSSYPDWYLPTTNIYYSYVMSSTGSNTVNFYGPIKGQSSGYEVATDTTINNLFTNNSFRISEWTSSNKSSIIVIDGKAYTYNNGKTVTTLPVINGGVDNGTKYPTLTL